VLGFFTAVSPLFLGQVLHETRHLVTGLVVFAVLGSSTVGQLVSARLPERTSLLGGCLALAAGVVVVAVGLATALLPVLVTGAVVAGLGQGASFRAGLQAVTGAAPADRRSEVSSSFFLVLYVAISIPVIGVGAGTQVFGLVPTAVVFAGVVALLAVAAFVSLLRRVPRRSSAPPAS
jgi:MFS family permease